VIPLIDGDGAGDDYLAGLCSATPPPAKVIQLGNDAAIECLSAWILEPALADPGNALRELLPNSEKRNLKNLQDALINKKKDRELRENLVWESLDNAECCTRACEFFHDIAAIALGESLKNPGWENKNETNGVVVFVASHVRRA